MVFIERFLKKNANELSCEDVEKFIKRHIEEHLNLDYKHIYAYEDFDELSKDISTFANSEGGLIILGIEETIEKNKIYPKRIVWGNKSLSKERLAS